MKLTKKDYEKILKHYGSKPVYDINKMTKKRKYNAYKTKALTRKILATKLCGCIKKVQKSARGKLNEKGAIAICRKSIFSNRGLKHYKFTCKKGAKLHPRKKTNIHLVKTKQITYKKQK